MTTYEEGDLLLHPYQHQRYFNSDPTFPKKEICKQSLFANMTDAKPLALSQTIIF